MPVKFHMVTFQMFKCSNVQMFQCSNVHENIIIAKWGFLCGGLHHNSDHMVMIMSITVTLEMNDLTTQTPHEDGDYQWRCDIGHQDHKEEVHAAEQLNKQMSFS